MAIYHPPPIYSKFIPILDLSPPPPSPTQYQYQTISNSNPPPLTNPSPITTYFSPPPPPPPLITTSPPHPLLTYDSPSLPSPSPPPPPSSPPPTPALRSPPPPAPITPVIFPPSPPPLVTTSSPPPLPTYDSPSLPTPSPPPPPPSPPPTPALWSPPPPPPLASIAPVISPPPLPTLPSPPSTSSCPPPLPAPALPSPPPPDIASVIPSPPSPSLPSPPPPTAISPPPPHLASPPLMAPQLPPTTLPESPPPPPIFVPPPLKPRVPTTTSPLPLPLPSPIHPRHSNANNFNASGYLGIKNGPSRNNWAMNGATATIAVLAGLMMLSFVGVGIWFVRQRKRVPSSGVDMPPFGGFSVMPELTYSRTSSFPLVRHGSGSYRFAYSPSNPGLANSRSFFSFEDLSFVTNGFSAQNLLAEGGFGPVYKGRLQDGREVAVKQLKVGGSQGEREFRAEIEIISRVHHRHLVSLVGYCILEHQRLLVYDYVPNRTLYYHLHGQGRIVMDWATRVKVAIGAARGIAYLHEDCQPRIIHRDIKSSNILLDNNFEAQVSDFGLAKLVMDTCTHVSTRVMGTFGYLAPEYASTGKLTDKSDVYSFGVVLLELVTGRKPVDTSQHLGDESLVEWARPLLSHALETGEVGELPDPRLDMIYNHRDMFRMIEAAAACIRRSATMRPRMGQMVRALGNLVDSDLTCGVRPGLSEVFNTGPNTEEIEIFQRTRFTSQDYNISDFR